MADLQPCISACAEKERLGINHGLCASCAKDLKDWMVRTQEQLGRSVSPERFSVFWHSVHELVKWTQHHSTCKRVTEAGDCSCGLGEAWKAIVSFKMSRHA